jgi:hypothetical protein
LIIPGHVVVSIQVCPESFAILQYFLLRLQGKFWYSCSGSGLGAEIHEP